MVTSINVAATNPLLAYQTAPIAPVAAIPGSQDAENDPATERQTALENKIKDFEAYLNGQGVSTPTAPNQTDIATAKSLADFEVQFQNFEAYLNGRAIQDAETQASVTSDQTTDSGTTDLSTDDSLNQGEDAFGDDPTQIFASYAVTDLDTQIQNFEAYLNQSSSFNSEEHSATDSNTVATEDQKRRQVTDDTVTKLTAQLQALEVYAARQALNLINSQPTAQNPDPDTIDQSSSSSQHDTTGGNIPVTTKPIDLGAVVNALERYLSKQGPAAISDPIQGQSSTPIPIFQTVQGRQDPLPVDGPEQANKTSAHQNDSKHETLSQDFGHLLEDLAILNLLANKKAIEFDPVRDLENKSTYKPPGESSPI